MWLQQSVVGFHEESLVGLPSSFLIFSRASFSAGLHFSESEGIIKLCVVRVRRRRNMHEGNFSMVDDDNIFVVQFICFLLGCKYIGIYGSFQYNSTTCFYC